MQFFVQKRTAFKTSLALFQVGEFSLAIFALASANDLISDELNQIMIITDCSFNDDHSFCVEKY